MHDSPRRRLLTGLAVSVPAVWSTPIIKSVLLPVHAQTSRPDDTPVCELPLTIENRTATCGGGIAIVEEMFMINDVNEDCPFVEETGVGTGSAELITLTTAVTALSATVAVEVASSPAGAIGQSCTVPLGDAGSMNSESVTAISGAVWNLSFNFVRTESPAAVAITNIQLSPP